MFCINPSPRCFWESHNCTELLLHLSGREPSEFYFFRKINLFCLFNGIRIKLHIAMESPLYIQRRSLLRLIWEMLLSCTLEKIEVSSANTLYKEILPSCKSFMNMRKRSYHRTLGSTSIDIFPGWVLTIYYNSLFLIVQIILQIFEQVTFNTIKLYFE